MAYEWNKRQRLNGLLRIEHVRGLVLIIQLIFILNVASFEQIVSSDAQSFSCDTWCQCTLHPEFCSGPHGYQADDGKSVLCSKTNDQVSLSNHQSNNTIIWLRKPQNVTISNNRPHQSTTFQCHIRLIDLNPTVLALRWLFNSVQIRQNLKYVINNKKLNNTVLTELSINNLDTLDSGYYRCDLVYKSTQVAAASAILKVLPGDNIYTYEKLEDELDVNEDEISRSIYTVDDVDSTAFCEPYRGSLCAHIIGKKSIYVTSNGQQDKTERQLLSSSSLKYFLHHQTSSNINEECQQSILFLTCVYAFPLCNDQIQFRKSNKIEDVAVRPRQLCRFDCNYVQNVACKSIFKDEQSNFFQKLKLPTCTELPPSSSHADCVSLSYMTNERSNSDHQCFNQTGKSYRGLVSQSNSGKPCLPWTSVTSRDQYKHLAYITHPELGNHQYCRNPNEDLYHQGPWCFVQKTSYSPLSRTLGNGIVQESCDIPKCGGVLTSDLWMVIVPSVMIPVGLAFLLILTYLIFCKRKSSKKYLPDGDSAGSRRRLYRSNNFSGAFTRSNSKGTNMLAFDNFNNQISDGSLLSNNGPLKYNCLTTTPLLDNGDEMLLRSNVSPSVAGKSSNMHSETSSYSVCKDILPQQIKYIQEAGEGRFGVCYIAELSDDFYYKHDNNNRFNKKLLRKNVYFVRTLKNPQLLDQFLSECHALTNKPPRHPNLACLVGLCQEPPSAFFENLPFTLHELLVSSSKRPDFEKLEKVILAMIYLSTRKIVHKDIAARNILIGENGEQVKLCDFGPCKPAYLNDYYKLGGSMLPVRWMAPESVLTGAYSAQSDVWSFGILLWEWCMCGRRPHDMATNVEVVERLRSRQLLPTQDITNKALCNLMNDCWSLNPSSRPNVSDLLLRFRQLCAGEKCIKRSCVVDNFQFKV